MCALIGTGSAGPAVRRIARLALVGGFTVAAVLVPVAAGNGVAKMKRAFATHWNCANLSCRHMYNTTGTWVQGNWN